jgi:beta-lactamase regulating signal transducer with metallopeptidase domain
VRPNSANRAFTVLVTVAFAGYVVLGVGACVLLCVVAYRALVAGGWDLGAEDPELWAAATFLGVVGAGTLAALWSLVRQLVASSKLRPRMLTLSVTQPPKLLEAMTRTGTHTRVDVVDHESKFSFVYGMLSPRIVLSRGLLETTTPRELDAVLAHEQYHVRNLDPLKVLLARALPRAFFYLPVLGALRRRYILARELAADRQAAATYGPAPLAGALFKALRDPDWPDLSSAAAIGGADSLGARITQLETGAEPPLERLPLSSALLSVVGAALLTAAFYISLLGFGRPAAP